MFFETRAEAKEAFFNQLLVDEGVSAFRWVSYPDLTNGTPDIVLLEFPNGDGTSTVEVVGIGGRYAGQDPDTRELQFFGELRSDFELLSGEIVTGSLEQVEFSNPSNVAGTGYDQKFSITFQTQDGPETKVLYNDYYLNNIGEFDRDSTDEINPAFVRDLAFVEERVTDTQGTSGADQVELRGVSGYRGYKGDDVILARESITVFSGSGDDIIQTRSGDDVLFGNQNDDQIFSGRGTDYVDGGTGDDRIFLGETGEARGGKGNDHIESEGNGMLFGGQGADFLSTNVVGGTLVGGDGADRLYGGFKTNGDDETGDVLYGGKSNDSIFGGANGDEIYGGTGNDVMHGWTGDDVMRGGSGHDTALGGDGDDTIYGGDGNDSLVGGDGEDEVYGGKGNDVIATHGTDGSGGGYADGGNGNDELVGGGIRDDLIGGKGNDTLSGQGGRDVLFGGAGSDQLFGGAEDDNLYGGDGDDVLEGGDGVDYLFGDKGDDTLTGGEGNDRFTFHNDGSTDVVTDFTVGQDDINMLGFDRTLTFDDLFLSQDDSTAVITAGDTVIRLENTDMDDLDEASFLL